MPADPTRIAIARDLLTQLGVSLADLHDAETPGASVPTLADYLPSVIAAAGPGANRTYGSYWSKMAAAWAPAHWTRSQQATSKPCNTRWPRPRGHGAAGAGGPTTHERSARRRGARGHARGVAVVTAGPVQVSAL